MPRETVHHLPDSTYRITVGWQRDKDVQVGFEATDGRSIAEHLQILKSGSDQPSGVSHGDTSLWSGMSRAGINDLIRLLRKARDAAYGRDE